MLRSSRHIYDELERVATDAATLDLRPGEGKPTPTLLQHLAPEVLRVLDAAVAITREALAQYDEVGTSSQPPAPDQSDSLDREIDRMLEGDPSRSRIADLAFVAICDLRQKRERVAALDASFDSWDTIETLGSALRRTRKSLTAIAVMVAELKGFEHRLHFATELESSIRVRREYSKLRQVILGAEVPIADTLRGRLRGIGTQLAMLVGRDLYRELRVSDRVQIRSLQNCILDWLREPTNAIHTVRDGFRLWQDLAAFAECLRQISRRLELVQHDGAAIDSLLERAAGARRHDELDEASRAIAERLFGLDDDVDLLIDAGRWRWLDWEPSIARLLPPDRVSGELPLRMHRDDGEPNGNGGTPDRVRRQRGMTPSSAELDGSPSSVLSQLCATGQSGELVCVMSDAEVHVYLQEGRIAWATSSSAQFAFAKYLLDTCGLEPAALAELVRECQQNRRPLGETLIEWRLASEEQVRAGLREQIRDALHTLRNGSGRAVFLRQRVRVDSYDRRFTFDLPAVVNAVTPSVAPKPRTTRPPSSRAVNDDDFLRQVVEGSWELAWASVVRDDATGAQFPPGIAPRDPGELNPALQRCGADYLGIRHPNATRIVIALPGRRSYLWCGLSDPSAFGHAVSLLSILVGRVLGTTDGPAQGVGCPITEPRPCAAARELCERRAGPRCDARRRRGAAAARMARRASTRLLERLRVPLDALLDAVERHCGVSPHGPRPAIVLGVGRLWHYAGRPPEGSRSLVWLVVDRSASQGLGWALHSALTRRFADLEGAR